MGEEELGRGSKDDCSTCRDITGLKGTRGWTGCAIDDGPKGKRGSKCLGFVHATSIMVTLINLIY